MADISFAQYADWAYLIGAILFVLTLRGLSSPASAVMGNRYGMFAMALAIISTFFVADNPNIALILVAMISGGAIGLYKAETVPMTQMPETVALMHSLVGLAAVLIAIAAVLHAGIHHDGLHRFELFMGCMIGAITFTASIFAFGKLSVKKWAKTLKGRWVKIVQVILKATILGFGVRYCMNEDLVSFYTVTALALLFGYFWIAPIGGGDMPVVISLLNSLSGWAAAGIGFTLNNSMLIIAGSLVGSSGAILSYTMCHAMNRSLFHVLFGDFGADSGAADDNASSAQKSYRTGSSEDAAFLLSNADSVVIIPGYGLAQARAQNAVKELSLALKAQGVTVHFAIHPVAGRMPGHMNVLLAESDVPYDDVKEMEEINSDFPTTDVALIVGANDVVNPAAKTNSSSPIYGMPILEAYKAHAVLVIKRSMATGYAGLDNDLFYLDKTMMIFGDAKKVIEDMVKGLHGNH